MRIEEFKRKLLSTPESSFPGGKAHLEMTPYKKDLIMPTKEPRLSAVMVLAYENNQKTEILLLKRSDYQGVHSAQVSFPGGKKDDTDPDLLFTAQRELKEETGIDADKIQILGPLSTMYIPPSNFMVHPFLAICESQPEVNLNQRESQYHFGIQLTELLDDAFLSEKDILTSYGKIKNVPYFHLNDEVIWGATAGILNELKWILKSR